MLVRHRRPLCCLAYLVSLWCVTDAPYYALRIPTDSYDRFFPPISESFPSFLGLFYRKVLRNHRRWFILNDAILRFERQGRFAPSGTVNVGRLFDVQQGRFEISPLKNEGDRNMASHMKRIPMFLLVACLFLGATATAGPPIGVPPQELPDGFTSLAPETCLVYAASSGTTDPDPTSTNATELLLAEPEIQDFLAEADRVILAILEKLGEQEGPEARQVVETAYQSVLAALSNPWCLYLEDIDLGVDGEGTEVSLGAAMYLGEESADWEATIDSLFALIEEEGGFSSREEFAVETVNGVSVYTVMERGVPFLQWTFSGEYLLIGAGEGSLESLLARQQAAGAPPEWLAVMNDTTITRIGTFAYVDIEKVKATILQALGIQGLDADQDEFLEVLDFIGVTNAEAIVFRSGLDDETFVDEAEILFDGPPTGLVAALAGGAITPESLEVVPADANIAAAYNIDLEETVELLLDLADLIQPAETVTFDQGPGEEPYSYDTPAGSEFIRTGCMMSKMQFGVDPIADVLPLLEDTIVVYNSPSEGGVFLTGLTLSIGLKDPAAFLELQEILIEGFREMMGPELDEVLRTIETPDGTMYTVRIPEEEIPFTTTWAVTGDRLIVSLVPQNIRAILSRNEDYESLAATAAVAPLLAADAPPCGLVYFDEASLLEMFYPFLLYAANMPATEIEQELDIDVNTYAIPSLGVLMRHWRPCIQSIRMDGDRIVVSTSRTAPCSAGAVLPAMGALSALAVRSSDVSGVKTQNNLHQIAIAMHNYHDTYREFPPAYSTDEDGNPLLSWRVLILPFLGEGALYERFNLDEPWDSPDNLPLTDEVAKVYATLNTPPGMTRYLTVRHPRSPFPGEEGLSFADITDGTSNTIMVVEANPSDAVVWTKPDDWVPPENTDETQWLEDVINGGCYVAMCDGSSHFFDPFEFSYDEFVIYFMRNDGTAVRGLYNHERSFIDEIGRGLEDIIEDLIWEVLIDNGIGFSSNDSWAEPDVWDATAEEEWATEEASWDAPSSGFGGEVEKDIDAEVEILEESWDGPAMPESGMMSAPMSSMPPGMGMPMDPMNPMGVDPMGPGMGMDMGIDPPLNQMGGAFDGPMIYGGGDAEEKDIDGFGEVEESAEPMMSAPGMEADPLTGPWADMMQPTTDDEVEKNINGEPTEISEMGGMSVVEDGAVQEKDIKGEPADLGELFDIPDVLPEPEEPAEEEKDIASEGWRPSE
jgi:hypothetical protein